MILSSDTAEETKQPAMSATAADAKAEHFELNNGTIRVTVTNYGATITSLYVPDKHGSFPFSFSAYVSVYFVVSLLDSLLCVWGVVDVMIVFLSGL